MKHLHLSFCLAGLVLTSCSVEPPAVRSDDGRPIKMLTVGQASNDRVREYLGTTAAAQEVQLGFEVSGQIVEFSVSAGQRVAAGDLIAKLDPTNFDATNEAAVAKLAAAQADLERKRGLLEVGGVSKVAFETAQRLAVAAASDVATAQKGLSDTELRAPFSGIIATTTAENFANIRRKQPVVTLQDPSWMEIEVHIPEVDAALAVPGLSLAQRNQRIGARVFISALEGHEFPANVSEFSTSADPVTRTYAATFVFKTPTDVNVLAGMSAHVSISTQGKQTKTASHRLPLQVVAGDDEKNPYVWIIGADMTASKRPVEVGEIAGSMILILSGLDVGDRVALTGVHHLREGLTVREWELE